ncbi:MAG: 5'/3'-nucleotidase SurE [Alphaproteobacteria bacterium]|nr:5'/3'-nucleotidase SurE [Alphaproteobacteria bacterium]
MAKSPLPMDLAKARILISNDDGIHAPGLKILEKAAHKLCKDVWVMAPEHENSGAGHSLTLRQPIRMRQLSSRRFACDGTPTDCVLLAINHLLKDDRPTLVLAGINRGANLGEDVHYSGTVAAAMEAVLLGVPSIALSLSVPWGQKPHWQTAEAHTAGIIKRLAKIGWPDGVLMNVNFPHVANPRSVLGVKSARQGQRKIGDTLVQSRDPRGVPYWWVGDTRVGPKAKPGTDLATVLSGYIAVTPIGINMTNKPALAALKRVLD